MANTGPQLQGAAVNNADAGDVAWVFVVNLWAASPKSMQTSQYLHFTDFGFSIPGGATIDGVVVSISKTRSGSPVVDHTVQLIVGGTRSGDNKADTVTAWPTSTGIVSHGGSSDVWGASLTPAIINSSNFGVAVRISNPSAGINTGQIVNSGEVTIDVYYTEGGGGDFEDGDFDIEGTGTASFQGRSRASASLTSSGEAEALLVGASRSPGDLVISASSQALFSGSQVVSAALEVSGGSSVSLDAASVSSGDMDVDGTSTFNALGASDADAILSADGTSDTDFISSPIFSAILDVEGSSENIWRSAPSSTFSVSGTSQTDIIGSAIFSGLMQVDGTSTSTFYAESYASGQLSADGTSDVTLHGRSHASGNMTAEGDSTAEFESISLSDFHIEGISTSAFVPSPVAYALFSFSGVADVSIESSSSTYSEFSISGSSTFTASGLVPSIGDFSISGTSTVEFEPPMNGTFSMEGSTDVSFKAPQRFMTDWLYPDIGTQGAEGGRVSWSNPQNIVAPDGNIAAIGLTQTGSQDVSQNLIGLDFDVPISHPFGLLGIEVRIQVTNSSLFPTIEQLGILTSDGIVATKDVDVLGFQGFITFGGPEDLWDKDEWNYEDIISDDFGFFMRVRRASTINALWVDSLSMRIHYGPFVADADLNASGLGEALFSTASTKDAEIASAGTSDAWFQGVGSGQADVFMEGTSSTLFSAHFVPPRVSSFITG